MAGKEEENYLDKLLGSVGVEGLSAEEPKSIFGDRDDSDYDKAEVIEALTDINDPNGDTLKAVEEESEKIEELSQEAEENVTEGIISQDATEDVMSQSAAADVISQGDAENVISQSTVAEELTQNYGTDKETQVVGMDEVTQENEAGELPQEIEGGEDSSQGAAEGEVDQSAVTAETAAAAETHNDDRVPDFSEPELSDGDMERLAGMGLDTIIDDVSSDTFSVEELFGEDGIGDIKLDSPTPETKTAEADIASAVNEPVEAQGDTSAPQETESAAVAAAAAAVGGADLQKAPEKGKKKKKGIGQFIKNIFFESTEETPEASKAKKAGKKAGTDAKKDEKEAIKKDINAGADGVEELDENQRLIYEMYGNSSGTEEVSAPKKGFFAKIKYRIQQMMKKNQEEDKLEQEAEDREYEEKKKIKAEKKEAGKVKKDEAKQARAEKQKSKAAKKAEKPKKEKKPKPQPKPEDILKIKPKAMVMFVLFVAGAIILISMLNSTVNYNNSVAVAKYNMENGNYSEVYEALSGLKLHKEDQSLYDQASAIMYVQRQYESYENYSSLGMHTEAINALIKGLERYNLYYNKAVELGVNKQVDEVRAKIIKKLEEDYKISETEANKLLIMSEENFTQYYSKIEAYGKVKK